MASILVIDDSATIRELLRMVLEGAGHTVRLAVDGEDGLAQYLQEKPDLVITDLVMPNANGAETIKAIKEHDPAIPIIAMSGSDGRDELQTSAQASGAAVIGKPFRNAILLGLVKSALDGAAR